MVNAADHLGLVHAVARKRARGQGARFGIDELVQEGVVGLMYAVRRFDPTRGAFSTCASWAVHAAIDAFIVEKGGRLVKLPVVLARKLNKEAELPLPPLEFLDREHESEGPSPEDLFERAETAAIVWAAVEKLPPRDAALLKLYFKKGLSLEAIGKRKRFRMSRETVRQRLEDVLAELRPYLKKRLEK